MFEKPLLQDNIWDNFLHFNYTYFTTRAWPMCLGIVLAVLIVCLFFLRNCLRNKQLYTGVFAGEIFKFNKKSLSDWLGLLAVAIVIIFTEVYMYTGENSLFENYDLMAINTTRSMRFGLVASFDYIRVIPLASWYLSTLYAITQNILAIKFFVVLQIIFMAWSLYVFFNYIPVAKRLVMIAILLFMPTVLQTSNIIFPERDMVIVLMLGLIFARKYCVSHKLIWAALFIFFVNVAFYTKETCITFYFGILLTSIFYNIIKGRIVMASFVRPWRIIMEMPLEFLIGVSLFCYTVIYELLQGEENFYISANNQSIWQQLVNYRMELTVLGAAMGIAIYRMIKNFNISTNPLFRSGLLIGAFCSAALIVVILKLSPSTPHLAGKSYYMLVSTIFALAYLFEYISCQWILRGLSVLLVVYSAYMNMMYYRQSKGEYYRQVAEFLAEHTIKNRSNMLFVMEGPYATKSLWQWIVETWSTAYRYYFNDRIFVIKSDVHYLDRSVANKINLYNHIPEIYFPMVPAPLPIKGDWLVINKNNQTAKAVNLRKDYKDNLVYENALFEVYAPK